MPPEAPERRIAAVVLPELLCELGSAEFRLGAELRQSQADKRAARSSSRRAPPLGVVMVDNAAIELEPSLTIDSVSAAARKFGVREGQTIAEACALISKLCVRAVARDQVLRALAAIAETALAFGTTVAFEAPDTVWLDVTGVAHLFGGEAELAAELAGRVRKLGHVVRVAVASGPCLARAFARWGVTSRDGVRIVPDAQSRAEAAALPVHALPLAPDLISWLARVGVLTIGDLSALPPSASAPRLGESAALVLALCQGRDTQPLTAHRPASLVVEESSWDEPVSGFQPLLFVLRGLAARMSARLAGRGEAAQKLELVILHDPVQARFEKVEPEQRLHFDLASPLWRESELCRVVAARLERARLSAPSVGLRLEAPALIRAMARQLDFSRVLARTSNVCPGVEQLPVLLAELSADIGKNRVGILEVVDSHRPEKNSRLRAALSDKSSALPAPARKSRPRSTGSAETGYARLPGAPARLLPRPVPFEAPLRKGATALVGSRFYSVERVRFEHRLDAVEWWANQDVARDYFRVWLRHADGGFESLIYVDRSSGKRYLQAILD